MLSEIQLFLLFFLVSGSVYQIVVVLIREPEECLGLVADVGYEVFAYEAYPSLLFVLIEMGGHFLAELFGIKL